MSIELIKEIKNEEDGLAALIMDGNEKYNYRVVLRDTDAEETIQVIFCHNYIDVEKFANEFVFGLVA